MRDDELDRILASEEDIVPSSGFHASVMAAVHRQATAPPPIPFPWSRALPALTATALALVVALVVLVQSDAAAPALLDALLLAAKSLGAPWIALAAAATALSLLLSRRFACEST